MESPVQAAPASPAAQREGDDVHNPKQAEVLMIEDSEPRSASSPSPIDVTYTPTEDEKNTALAVIGWALREEANRLTGHFWGIFADIKTSADGTVAMLQRAWDRYTERVANR